VSTTVFPRAWRPAAFAFAAFLTLALAWACGGGGPAPTPTTPAPTSAPAAATTPTPTITPAPSVTPVPTTHAPQPDPVGFPINPQNLLGIVTGVLGSRTLGAGGSTAIAYARDDQPSDDPELANRSGWNCRTHVEYEGAPAVDFYVPPETAVRSTMDGTATLYAISIVNDFDRYGIPREPYLGNPDRSRAPISPFPGPSAGLGVYVQVKNDGFVTTYGHLDLPATAQVIPPAGLFPPFVRNTNFANYFASQRIASTPTVVATWHVVAGQLIGRTGDAGYSEGPHLHYTVQRGDSTEKLCPTLEAGFTDGGWLFSNPSTP
jgi:hypothetical protein